MLARLLGPKNRLNHLGDDRQFVQALYQLVPGREPDPGGLAFHLGRLRQGQADRDQLVRDFIRSDECQYRLLIKYPAHKVLFDYVKVACHALEHPPDISRERLHTPHLLLAHKGMVYTSVMLFFRKS